MTFTNRVARPIMFPMKNGALLMVAGTVLALAAGVLFFFASALFVFYGVCLDVCDDTPPWSFGGALEQAFPWLVPGLALMTIASSLFMAAAPGQTRPVRAVGLALVSAVAFLGGFLLFVVSVSVSGTFAVLLGLVLAIAWLIGTSALSWRFGARRPH